MQCSTCEFHNELSGDLHEFQARQEMILERVNDFKEVIEEIHGEFRDIIKYLTISQEELKRTTRDIGIVLDRVTKNEERMITLEADNLVQKAERLAEDKVQDKAWNKRMAYAAMIVTLLTGAFTLLH